MHEQSERAVRERIEATRERMGDTIEQIGDRVNPDRVQRELKARAREQVDEFKENVKEKARSKMRDVEHEVSETGRGIWETIKDNPIPAGMVGVGLAWLMANGASHSRERHSRYGTGYRAYPEGPGSPYATGFTGAGEEVYLGSVGTGGMYAAGYSRTIDVEAPLPREYEGEGEGRIDEMKGRAGEAAERVREKGEHAVETAREKGEHAVDAARERTSELAHRASEGMHDVRDRARHWADETQYRARRMERRVEDSVQENPLAAGAIAAALGFAAGMIIPETRKEHEMFGPTRDRVMDRAQDSVRRAGQKAKEAAKETASDSARHAVDEMWPSAAESERESVSEPGR